jgi:hypothetical protein
MESISYLMNRGNVFRETASQNVGSADPSNWLQNTISATLSIIINTIIVDPVSQQLLLYPMDHFEHP